ncbi:MAG: hypothetical protein QG672_2700 [Pseudomonadota bacterium]|nr:hypothetical protein [Pseudomonadota bacterium]
MLRLLGKAGPQAFKINQTTHRLLARKALFFLDFGMDRP